MADSLTVGGGAVFGISGGIYGLWTLYRLLDGAFRTVPLPQSAALTAILIGVLVGGVLLFTAGRLTARQAAAIARRGGSATRSARDVAA